MGPYKYITIILSKWEIGSKGAGGENDGVRGGMCYVMGVKVWEELAWKG